MAAMAVLMSAEPLLIRCPGGDLADQYSLLPSLAYVNAKEVVESPHPGADHGAIISLMATLVRAPAAGIVVPLRTYADGAVEAGTNADASALYATYLAALRGH